MFRVLVVPDCEYYEVGYFHNFQPKISWYPVMETSSSIFENRINIIFTLKVLKLQYWKKSQDSSTEVGRVSNDLLLLGCELNKSFA